jgi:hypothetical protein
MTESICYVGIAPCGCVQAAVAMNPNNPQDLTHTNRAIASFAKWGTVERMPIEQVRVVLCLAKHPKRKRETICPHPKKCPERVKPWQKDSSAAS